MKCSADLLTTEAPCYAGQFIRLLSTTSHRSTMKKRLILPIALILPTLAACGGGNSNLPAEEPDLVAVLKARPNLTRFADALETSGVAGELVASGSYTVFAPMNRAINGQMDEATVRHHILPDRVTFSDMAGESTSYETLNNDDMEIDVTDQIVIGSGLMVESDIEAANGIIHVIDSVQTAAPTPARLIDQQSLQPATGAEAIDGTTAPAGATSATN